MREQIEQRLEQLRQELASGQQVEHDLKIQLDDIQRTLLRIGGAIQVLEEELAKADAAAEPIECPVTVEE